MSDPLTEAEEYPYGKIDATGQPMQLGEEPLPAAPVLADASQPVSAGASKSEDEIANLGDFA